MSSQIVFPKLTETEASILDILARVFARVLFCRIVRRKKPHAFSRMRSFFQYYCYFKRKRPFRQYVRWRCYSKSECLFQLFHWSQFPLQSCGWLAFAIRRGLRESPLKSTLLHILAHSIFFTKIHLVSGFNVSKCLFKLARFMLSFSRNYRIYKVGDMR
jgi:hypothetical protein